MHTLELKEQIPSALKLEDYDVSPECGFLPAYSLVEVPLPEVFWKLQQTAAQLPKWLTTGGIRQVIESLPTVHVDEYTLTEMQLRRLMQVYSFLTHAYVWGEPKLANILPRNIAAPFHQVSQQLGRPPVLSYSSYALDNWVRIHETGAIAIGNIKIIQNFLGGLDEDWFILIHIEIEAKAAPALAAIPMLLEGINRDNIAVVLKALGNIRDAWSQINATMNRMPEACDPYIFYHRVRPYLYGWKNNPALPEGLIYEGVAAYNKIPQQFRGATGAQGAIIPTMDALFNIGHETDLLQEYLLEMRNYMPPKHRAFLEEIEKHSTLRNFVKGRMARVRELRDSYNACVSLVERFRSQHLGFVSRYIAQQAAKAKNDANIGTGGTPFMKYLKKHRDANRQHLLK
ncbi:MAG: hypothetical protein QNJ46_06760 [Leptolyngbyaceae cyanobacterium MO_188.B28]|nr:hypothetical protein [Leptolyngbyaceae cyanobacterium MO_188.B28]